MTGLNDFQLLVLEKETVSCEDVSELLGDYVDRELCPTLRTRLEGHICACERCQEMLRTYRFTIELAGELSDRPVPSGVQNRLRKALNERLGLKLAAVPQEESI